MWLKNNYQQHSTQDEKTLNVNVEEFQPKRSTPAVSEHRIKNIGDIENQRETFDLHHQMGREQCGNLKVMYSLMNYV